MNKIVRILLSIIIILNLYGCSINEETFLKTEETIIDKDKIFEVMSYNTSGKNSLRIEGDNIKIKCSLSECLILNMNNDKNSYNLYDSTIIKDKELRNTEENSLLYTKNTLIISNKEGKYIESYQGEKISIENKDNNITEIDIDGKKIYLYNVNYVFFDSLEEFERGKNNETVLY